MNPGLGQAEPEPLDESLQGTTVDDQERGSSTTMVAWIHIRLLIKATVDLVPKSAEDTED